MSRSNSSRKQQSNRFAKFIARLERSFSSRVIRSSTRIVTRSSTIRPETPRPVPRFPANSTACLPKCHLNDILYDPTRQIEYLSDIDESDSDLENSTHSDVCEDGDSCYDSMSDHRHDKINLSRMNISNVDNQECVRPLRVAKLPSTVGSMRFHSTAIYDISQY